jgi:phosphatidylserine synthase 2
MTEPSFRGLVAAITMFLSFGMIHFKRSPFLRPHFLFWKLVLGASVVYQMFLTIILFQNKSDVRYVFHYIDPSLGQPIHERHFGHECALTWHNLFHKMDEFVIAHALGWFAKSLILRDRMVLWVHSIMFELMEYTFEHEIPNFSECWWDHLLLDVFSMNWLGIWLGMKACDYLSMRTYTWLDLDDIPTTAGKLKRAIQQFTPYEYDAFHWDMLKDLKHFLYVAVLIYFVSIFGLIFSSCNMI